MRRAALCALTIGIVASIALNTVFASAPTIVSTTIEPAQATIGDRLTLTIIIDHDAATTLASGGFGASAGELEIVAVAPPRTERHNNELRTTLAFTLAAFRTGELTVPAQTIAYRSADGEGTLTTNAVAVRIVSVLAPGDAELRPLKPQIDLKDPAPPPVVPALVVMTFGSMTMVGYLLARRAIAVKAPEFAMTGLGTGPRPPQETARGALDEIAAAGLATTDVAEYYARIAATVRSYVSARFAFPAYAMTRSELEHGAADAGIERWPARLVANLLEQCDAVEFAAFRPAAERRAADLVAAYEIVDLTAREASPSETAVPGSP